MVPPLQAFQSTAVHLKTRDTEKDGGLAMQKEGGGSIVEHVLYIYDELNMNRDVYKLGPVVSHRNILSMVSL